MNNTTKQNDTIPINWIKKYAKENGPEVQEIIGYMIKEYLMDTQNSKS